MNLINPIGRDVKSDFSGDISIAPKACMCSGNEFATGQGDDGCFNCGCYCSDIYYDGGNEHIAFWKVRKS